MHTTLKVFNRYTKGYLGTYFSSGTMTTHTGTVERIYYKRPRGTIGHIETDRAHIRAA